MLFCGLFSVLQTSAQDLNELLELHRENLQKLYMVRGTPKEWARSGKVTESDLVQTLRTYDERVLLLIYTHANDTLYLTGIHRSGAIGTQKRAITKDSLIQLVQRFNQQMATMESPIELVSRGGHSRSGSTLAQAITASDLTHLILPSPSVFESFDHVIFVPMLNLGTLPFAALPLTDTTYLIDACSYSIAPSVLEVMISKTVNDNSNERRYQHYGVFKHPLLVANPTYPEDSIHHFANLPGTLREVDSVQKRLQADTVYVLTGDAATEANVRAHFCTADLLYFATHGVSDWKDPMNSSYLVLAPDADSTGYFTAREIHDSRKVCILKAQLVVMSACQSGLGMGHDGGVIGLSRAFQIAGANHVVMSLWNIDDQATAELMSQFVSYLPNDLSLQPHEAMRQAMIFYRNNIDPNPKNWAAFSIFGVPYTSNF